MTVRWMEAMELEGRQKEGQEVLMRERQKDTCEVKVQWKLGWAELQGEV